MPADVTGTFGVPPLDRLSVTLGACDPSGVYGEFRRLFTGQYCTYQLTYRGMQDDAIAFVTTSPNTFHCGYDLPEARVLVRPTPDGLDVSVDAPPLGWQYSLPPAVSR